MRGCGSEWRMIINERVCEIITRLRVHHYTCLTFISVWYSVWPLELLLISSHSTGEKEQMRGAGPASVLRTTHNTARPTGRCCVFCLQYTPCLSGARCFNTRLVQQTPQSTQGGNLTAHRVGKVSTLSHRGRGDELTRRYVRSLTPSPNHLKRSGYDLYICLRGGEASGQEVFMSPCWLVVK